MWGAWWSFNICVVYYFSAPGNCPSHEMALLPQAQKQCERIEKISRLILFNPTYKATFVMPFHVTGRKVRTCAPPFTGGTGR